MMPRVFLVWLVLASTMGWLVYKLKYEVQEREARLLQINRDIVEEQEATHILRAEWAYLNHPRQLDQANSRLLGLEPVRNIQMVDISAIPMRGAAHPGAEPAPLEAAPTQAQPVAPDLDDDGPTTGPPSEEIDAAPGSKGPDAKAADTFLMIRNRLTR